MILNKMRKILIYVFYITSVFTIFKVMVVGSSVLAGSYGSGTSATVSQSTNLLSFLNNFSYIAYLSTIPTIKQIKKTLPLFVILTIASIALGARGNAVCVLLFVIVYLLSRDFYQNKGDEFLPLRIRVTLLILSPIVLIGLSLFAFVRSGNVVESHGIYYDIIGFFIQQGGTGNLISLGNDLKTSLPSQNISYTFGPLINLIKDYAHIQSTTGDPLLYEATQGNNLGATLTYLTQPNYYFKGGGLGTSYMAELYIDFGYWGIIIYNFILGVMLRFISFDVKKNLIGRIICNFIIIGIFFLPRDFALSVSRLLTPAYIICFFGIMYLYTLCKYNWPMKLNNPTITENRI